MYKYDSSLIANLAAQLKRGPQRLRLRQLGGIEFVLSVCESDRSYPFEFVLHALTGFRPRSTSSDGNGNGHALSQLIDRETIRRDLVTLAEDLSASADLPASTWAEPLYSVSDLAKRFDVSTKTIFRWHHRGLIGWRFRFSDRRMRLVFPDRCVRRFVAENSDLVHRGSSFSQLSAVERQAIIDRARALADGPSRTVNAVAKIIAAEAGRAVETIRLILKHYDEAHPQKGIFNRSSLKIDADDVRLKVWEAYREGVSVNALAERFSRPGTWVYRTITEMRAREMQARKIEHVVSPDFDSVGAERAVFGDPALGCPYGEVTPARRVPADLPPYLQQLFRIPLLSPAGEVALFRKLNYLRWKADRLRASLDPDTASATQLDEIEALLEAAGQVKNQIVQSNLRLVVSIAKRHLTPGQDFFEVVSDGNISLMRAVDKFDYNRGFKFSTYASWAIMKNYARSVPEQLTQRDRYQTGREEMLENTVGVTPDEHENEHLPAVRTTVERMLGVLDTRERLILRQRYGLDDQGEPQTLEQIGQKFGVSKERVRQLESRAMARLRSEFEIDARALLGA